MGMINIVKMDILPKIYVFQTIPLYPSTNILNQLCKAIGSFIWAGKLVRISWNVLYRLKKDGGLNLPDISMYLRAVFVSRIVDWFHNSDCKQWVKLEEEVTAIKLKSLPWISRDQRPPRGYMPIKKIKNKIKKTRNKIKCSLPSEYGLFKYCLFFNSSQQESFESTPKDIHISARDNVSIQHDK